MRIQLKISKLIGSSSALKSLLLAFEFGLQKQPLLSSWYLHSSPFLINYSLATC